jgi:hypothetical protein
VDAGPAFDVGVGVAKDVELGGAGAHVLPVSRLGFMDAYSGSAMPSAAHFASRTIE